MPLRAQKGNIDQQCCGLSLHPFQREPVIHAFDLRVTVRARNFPRFNIQNDKPQGNIPGFYERQGRHQRSEKRTVNLRCFWDFLPHPQEVQKSA